MLKVVEKSNKTEKVKPKYETINGWTHPLPCWQILAIGLMFVIEIINFYLLHKIIDLGFVVLYVLEGISIVFLVLIIVYFFLLTFSDPSDPRLKDPSYSQPQQKLNKCYGCMTKVSQTSYHCSTCKRCVDNFDHHCVFLNNCIGGQNYPMFWKFLLWMFIHMALGISIDLVIFVEEEGWNRWLALAIVIVQFVVLLEVTILGIFHCYIGFCLYKTTLQVLRGDKKSQVAPDTHTQPNAPETPKEPQPVLNSKMVSIRPSSQMEDKVVETPSPSKDKEQNPQESTEVGFKYGTL